MTDTTSSAASAHSNTEILDRKRNRSLLGFVISFVIWIMSALPYKVVVLYLGYTPPQGVMTFYWIFFGIGGLACWLFFLIRYQLIQRTIKQDPQLASALNDELVRYTWTRAAAIGFWVMLTTVGLFQFGKLFMILLYSAGIVPPTIFALRGFELPEAMAVGVGTTIVAYLYLRRD